MKWKRDLLPYLYLLLDSLSMREVAMTMSLLLLLLLAKPPLSLSVPPPVLV